MLRPLRAGGAGCRDGPAGCVRSEELLLSGSYMLYAGNRAILTCCRVLAF
jgi:hypothetical protein